VSGTRGKSSFDLRSTAQRLGRLCRIGPEPSGFSPAQRRGEELRVVSSPDNISYVTHVRAMSTKVLESSEPHPEAFLSRRQLAQRWGVCTETIKRRERAKQLGAIRFNGRLIRYRLSDIEQIEREALV